MAKSKSDLQKMELKLEKGKMRGKLSPNDISKQQEKILDKQNKIRELELDLQKSQYKLNKVSR